MLIERLRGVVVAAGYVMVEYDLPEDLLDRATAIASGMEEANNGPVVATVGWRSG
ncbi:MAG: hypothetical protein R2704_03210 [Microthrixaceae bacterium]